MKYLAKLYLTINDSLPVLLASEQDIGHENLVNTYLFYQVCKVHEILCFVDQFPNAEKSSHLSFRHFYLKLVSWMKAASLPNLCQIFNKNLIGTLVLGRNV